ncbi:5'-3' exoribonuclease 2 homolog [Daphnia pulex]|uniref:5'-3' exoribonuclease 2 homolog n=1 Tax=Daphnia pulex TaxID=6669 RepID=UPI001EDD48F6|nr:5'-3' exoribonuclease 2 homolog [Daphnia pulex]
MQLLPLEQLMSLLLPWSSTLVPLSWGNLMSDSNSTIAKFYPSMCKGSALPFLDEDLMKDAVKAVYDQLTDEEKERNTDTEKYRQVTNYLLLGNTIRATPFCVVY